MGETEEDDGELQHEVSQRLLGDREDLAEHHHLHVEGEQLERSDREYEDYKAEQELVHLESEEEEEGAVKRRRRGSRRIMCTEQHSKVIEVEQRS